jgi:hypothetical protein|tara:strand:+ start:112 stop:273 length:162 start_codon:yes stop_codon:yes gene_type:complete
VNQTLKQRASLRTQKNKVKAKRIYKERKVNIRYDQLMDGRVAKVRSYEWTAKH